MPDGSVFFCRLRRYSVYAKTLPVGSRSVIRGDITRAEKGASQERPFVITARNASALLRDLEPRSVVRVTVLSARADGTLRVRIGDRTLIAAGLQRLVPGDSFDARVSVEGGAVFLLPESECIDGIKGNVFQSLGIPETPLSAFVVSFFGTIGMRLESAHIRSVIKTASRFPGKELRAAEAAAILAERGIAPDDETVARMIRVMEGSGSGDGSSRRDTSDTSDTSDTRDTPGMRDERADDTSDGNNDGDAVDADTLDRDFCAFVNHKRGHALHWIVIPFRKKIAETPCSGSLRFLLDTARDRPLESHLKLTRITVLAASHDWDFSLTGDACSVAVNPAFPSVVFDQLVVYLKRRLAEAGISAVTAVAPGTVHADGIKSIDLEI